MGASRAHPFRRDPRWRRCPDAASGADTILRGALEDDVEADTKQVRDVLAAVAPIVGMARVVSATSKIMRALELEVDLLEIEAETEVEA